MSYFNPLNPRAYIDILQTYLPNLIPAESNLLLKKILNKTKISDSLFTVIKFEIPGSMANCQLFIIQSPIFVHSLALLEVTISNHFQLLSSSR